MGDGKTTKGATAKEIRAHIRRVLKQLLPKGGEKKKGAGDQTIGWKEIARAGAAGNARKPAVGQGGPAFSGKMLGPVPGRGSTFLPKLSSASLRMTCTGGAAGVGSPARAATIGVATTDGD